MGLIPQVKCGRCDRNYSGLRSRCPYCGAHRHKKGKRVTDSDNATWKLIIGVLLIVVLIAAVVVILVTGGDSGNEGEGNVDKKPPSYSDDGTDKQPGTSQPTTQISVTASDGSIIREMTLSLNGTTELTATVTTSEETAPVPTWSSTNPAVVTAAPVDETGVKCNITGVAEGTAIVTVTAGDAKYEINVTCGEQTPEDSTPSVPQTVVASSLSAKTRYHELVGKNNEFTEKIAETIEVTAIVTPSNVTSVPVWTSSDESVVSVVASDETGLKARCTGISKGTATITISVDAVEFTFLVRCNGQT